MNPPADAPHRDPPPRDVTPRDRRAPDISPRTVEPTTVEPSTPIPMRSDTAQASTEPTEPAVCRDWSNRDDRFAMIAEAAYFKAEKRGFGLGDEKIDWLEAERELIERLEGDHVSGDD